MNNTRREALRALIAQIGDIRDRLEGILDEEEEYRDNMPENLQCSERYAKAEEVCDELSSAVEDLEEVIGDIETAIE